MRAGGCYPLERDYVISADSSFANYYIYDAKNKIYFNVSPEELDKLYKMFYKNNFDKIKTFEEKVYDRGGNTVSLSWKDERISKSNSGISFIEKEWQEEYGVIVSAIRELVDSKIEELKINFTLKIDTSIVNLDLITNITIDTDFTYYSARDGVKDSINLNLLPGEHNVQAYLMTSGESELQSKVFASKHFVLDITEETNVINLYVEGKEIKWR